MEGEPRSEQAAPLPVSEVDPTPRFWSRVREHKIIQWGIGYLGAALALAQGEQLVGQAFGWPDSVTRVLMIVLVIGLPIALTVAWYHGHRGLKQISAGELAIVAVLLFIGAVFFVAVSPSSEEQGAASARDAAPDTRTDESTDAGSEPVPAPTTVERAAIPNSVAVLPLDNLSADPDSALYARGMHAEIISQLTKLRNVTVTGRDSVMVYAENRPPSGRIAADLGVKSLLVGTFQLVNDQIRIAVQLVDPATQTNLWSDEYQSDFADVFQVQADISMNVANALAVEFSAAEQADIERRPTTSDEAYRLYLQAVGVVAAATPDGYDIAQGLYDRALALDPVFAHAYGAKAVLYSLRLVNNAQGAGVSASEQANLVRQVRDYADKALALDPREQWGGTALVTLNVLTWRWSVLARDVEAQPEVGLGAYPTWVFAWMGRPADTSRIAEELFERNPNLGIAWIILAVSQTYAGDRQGSIVTLRRALDLQAVNPLVRVWLGYNHIGLGNSREGLAELQSVERQLGVDAPIVYLPELAYAYARLERPADAQRIFNDFRALAEKADPGAGAWAMAYWAIGDKAQTLHWLDVLAEKARNHEPDLGMVNAMNLKMNFLADPALETPEMRAALDRLTGD